MAYELNFLPELLDALGLASACIICHSRSATVAVWLALSERTYAVPERTVERADAINRRPGVS
jgi:hypothetical protein